MCSHILRVVRATGKFNLPFPPPFEMWRGTFPYSNRRPLGAQQDLPCPRALITTRCTAMQACKPAGLINRGFINPIVYDSSW